MGGGIIPHDTVEPPPLDHCFISDEFASGRSRHQAWQHPSSQILSHCTDYNFQTEFVALPPEQLCIICDAATYPSWQRPQSCGVCENVHSTHVYGCPTSQVEPPGDITENEEENDVDEPVPVYRNRRDLKAEAKSLWHLLTHTPKNKFCHICKCAKAQHTSHSW